MSYVTLAQLTARFGEAMLIALTDRAYPVTNTVDETVVDQALADTDALIDGYLVRRYQLPLTVTQPLLADVAGAIAIWKLHTSEPDPKIKADYTEAMAILGRIAAGTIGLSAAGVEAPNVAGTGVQITDRDRQLTQDNMSGFI